MWAESWTHGSDKISTLSLHWIAPNTSYLTKTNEILQVTVSHRNNSQESLPTSKMEWTGLQEGGKRVLKWFALDYVDATSVESGVLWPNKNALLVKSIGKK